MATQPDTRRTQHPTLHQLWDFLALTERFSFRRAVRACSVTQSTLSAQVQQMVAGPRGRGLRRLAVRPAPSTAARPAG